MLVYWAELRLLCTVQCIPNRIIYEQKLHKCVYVSCSIVTTICNKSCRLVRVT